MPLGIVVLLKGSFVIHLKSYKKAGLSLLLVRVEPEKDICVDQLEDPIYAKAASKMAFPGLQL